MAGLALKKADEELSGSTAHILTAVREGGDPRMGQLTILTVVKADHSQILGDTDALFNEVSHQTAGDLVVITDHGGAAFHAA